MTTRYGFPQFDSQLLFLGVHDHVRSSRLTVHVRTCVVVFVAKTIKTRSNNRSVVYTLRQARTTHYYVLSFIRLPEIVFFFFFIFGFVFHSQFVILYGVVGARIYRETRCPTIIFTRVPDSSGRIRVARHRDGLTVQSAVGRAGYPD